MHEPHEAEGVIIHYYFIFLLADRGMAENDVSLAVLGTVTPAGRCSLTILQQDATTFISPHPLKTLFINHKMSAASESNGSTRAGIFKYGQ